MSTRDGHTGSRPARNIDPAGMRGISQSCYRYESRRDAQNDEIENWLLRLTDNQRNWGFDLCFLYLRNVKGFGWNHMR